LTSKAFAVLRYLVERAGRLVTQAELLEAVCPETYSKPEVLKSRIFELRSHSGIVRKRHGILRPCHGRVILGDGGPIRVSAAGVRKRA
jgi:DNA-binding response OmpR family regulator